MSLFDSLKALAARPQRRDAKLGFFVVGVQKGGTTTLNRLLRFHPELEFPDGRKELHYFDDDTLFGPDHAPLSGDHRALHQRFRFGRKTAGEITPTYIFWKPALERIRAYNPEARLILLLRNPVARAFSHWAHLREARHKRHRHQPEEASFLELLAEEKRAAATSEDFQSKRLSLIARGRYAPQLARLRAIFPKEQALVLKSEAFFADQRAAADAVCRFLGVRPLADAPEELRANASSVGKISREEWDAAIGLFSDDIAAVERELGWDCSDWRKPPAAPRQESAA